MDSDQIVTSTRTYIIKHKLGEGKFAE